MRRAPHSATCFQSTGKLLYGSMIPIEETQEERTLRMRRSAHSAAFFLMTGRLVPDVSSLSTSGISASDISWPPTA